MRHNSNRAQVRAGFVRRATVFEALSRFTGRAEPSDGGG